MARFFIDRPIFAWVLAILVMMAGGIAVFSLPVAQFPPLAPPSVAVTVTYPGASAETVEGTVVQPIEQQMSGLDGLLYMSSESDVDLMFKDVLMPVLLDYPLESPTVYVVYVSRKYLPLKIRAFVDFFLQSLDSMPLTRPPDYCEPLESDSGA